MKIKVPYINNFDKFVSISGELGFTHRYCGEVYEQYFKQVNSGVSITIFHDLMPEIHFFIKGVGSGYIGLNRAEKEKAIKDLIDRNLIEWKEIKI